MMNIKKGQEHRFILIHLFRLQIINERFLTSTSGSRGTQAPVTGQLRPGCNALLVRTVTPAFPCRQNICYENRAARGRPPAR